MPLRQRGLWPAVAALLALPFADTAAAAGIGLGPLTGAAATVADAPTVDESAAAPTAVRSPRHLYMVRDLRRSGGIWTGEAAIIRKRGRTAVGIQGAFYSEFRCLTGTIRNGRLRGEYPPYRYAGDLIPAAPLDVRWVGSGPRQRMADWRSVTARSMSRFSGGGITKRLLDRC